MLLMSSNVFLDTCVLYPSLVRDFLLRIAEDEFYKPYWSDGVLEELKRNLLKADKTLEHIERLFYCMNLYFPNALIKSQEYTEKESLMVNDKKDRHILAAAIAAQAVLLVTDNIKDFPQSSTSEYEIKVQSVDDFLCDLFASNSSGILTTLLKLINDPDARKPRTFESITTQLEKSTPKFIKLIVKYYNEVS